MATDGTSWADQWGAGGIGAIEEDDSTTKTDTKKKSSSDSKAAAGLTKVKAAASASAQKIKSGTTNGFKWIKTLSQKKTTSSPPDK